MNVVNTDDLPNEAPRQPNRTIFPPPQAVVVEPMPRSSGALRGALIALVPMLILCGILGYVITQQNQRISDITQTTVADAEELLAEKDAQILDLQSSLQKEVASISLDQEIGEELTRLLTERASKRAEIKNLVATTHRFWGKLEDKEPWALEPKAWSEDATKILRDEVDELEALRVQILATPPPARRTPRRGTITTRGN